MKDFPDIEYLKFTKLAEDMHTPLEAVWIKIPVECVGQDEMIFVTKHFYGTEAIYDEMSH